MMTADAGSLPIGTRMGPYEIVGWIGAGGMGEVYRARDSRLGRDVAIKLIPEAFAADAGRVRRFEQQARAAGQLNHPNILAVYDIGLHAGAPYIVSELLEGESLRSRLHGGALPSRTAVDYARQMAEGLAAAHDKNIVHRDVKPDNLFITSDGRVKILDFGIAKLTLPREDMAQTGLPTETGAGMVVGTVGYMSPEQVRGENVDARSDIFSVGTVLYEMLTGRPAFSRATAPDTMAAILREDPPTPVSTDVSPALVRIVARCLEKTRETRFQSARDLAFGLEVLSDTAQTAALVQTQVTGSPLWLRGPLPWIVLGVIAIALAGTAAWNLRRPAPPPLTVTKFPLLLPQAQQFAGATHTLALSPDGTQIAYRAITGLFVRQMSEVGAKAIQGAAGSQNGSEPAFSPDGRSIVFFAGDTTLKRIKVTGGAAQTICKADSPFGLILRPLGSPPERKGGIGMSDPTRSCG